MSTCGSISRTPSVQPLTLSSSRATPKRASSGGTSMMDERISSGSRCTAASKRVSRWCRSSTRVVSSSFTWLPRARKMSRILRTSVMSGTPFSRSG